MDTIFLFLFFLISLYLCFKYKRNPKVYLFDHRYYKIVIFTVALFIAFLISLFKKI